MNFPTYLNLRSFSKGPPQYPPSDIDVPSCVMNSAIKRVIIVSTDGVTSVVWLCNTAAMKDLFCTLSHEYGSVPFVCGRHHGCGTGSTQRRASGD